MANLDFLRKCLSPKMHFFSLLAGSLIVGLQLREASRWNLKLAPILARRDQRKRPATPDWWVAVSKTRELNFLRLALDATRQVSAPGCRNLDSLCRGVEDLDSVTCTTIQMVSTTYYSRDDFSFGNGGQGYITRTGEGARSLWLPESSPPVNLRACPLDDLLPTRMKT